MGAGIQVLPSLREWETRTFKGVSLSAADRALVDRLGAAKGKRIQIDELREGLRVSARSWVGVVRLDSVEIRILPKLAGDQLGLVRLIEFTSGFKESWFLDTEAAVEAAGDSLLDLIALLFAHATERVVRRGLLADYIEREEDLRVVRGRTLADRQILERFGQLDRIICRFDELEHDVDENRLLLAALRVAARRVETPGVHRRIGRLRAILEPICDPSEVDLRGLRSAITYNRLNAHYERAHSLAWLVLDALGVDDLMAAGSTQSFAFLLDMNLLFERFVERLFQQVLVPAGYRVDSQVSHSSIIRNVTTEKNYSRVIPDLLVQRRHPAGRRLVVDAKYKLYDERRIDPSDIYQMFVYAFALSSTGAHTQHPEHGVPTAVLVYPSSGPSGKEVLMEVRPPQSLPGARVLAIGIPIPAALDELLSLRQGPVCERIESLVEAMLS